MPIPNPVTGESRKKFVSRCVGVLKGHGDTNPTSQLAAICHSKFDNYLKNQRGKKRVTHSPKKD